MSLDWAPWSERRPTFRGVHLDTAAAGRSSRAVLDAVHAHTLSESETGAYLAAADAAGVLDAGRALLGQLLGTPAAGVAYLGSASAALRALLSVWPLDAGATVGVTPSEWGPNLQAFTRAGLRVVVLDVEDNGRLDLDRLGRQLRTAPPNLVHLTQVAAHRGLVQPVAEAAALCRESGVPLWVDAAQALGHVDTNVGADAIWSTSRKWLGGPRGVGVLAVAEPWWDALRVERPVLSSDTNRMRWLEYGDAHVAGQIGLCAAVSEFADAGRDQVFDRLAEVGRLTRAELTGTPGWRVVDGDGAITALEPTDGQDVAAVRDRIRQQSGVVTTASPAVRAPLENPAPTLRVSPHVDCTPTMLRQLRAALTGK